MMLVVHLEVGNDCPSCACRCRIGISNNLGSKMPLLIVGSKILSLKIIECMYILGVR